MKAMVLMNLATDADLANGSRGVITDIILEKTFKLTIRTPKHPELRRNYGAGQVAVERERLEFASRLGQNSQVAQAA